MQDVHNILSDGFDIFHADDVVHSQQLHLKHQLIHALANSAQNTLS